ncbi:DUF418 domain-containing protein [Deinococcus maricopensis]|uniref:DUF418 domain-containing protein n=1 Tax=Deinococcus maricopensis (strain DSM 21211 / LMG 22137 / NRRL B-23946 / LB-34) TaxID=709986 RepID=E8U4K6_DEIML|nr:DUF418 domain-containing protein [Deinococcus maricopensis]ADV68871.1 protein of unknown function DUF418 [Deinococcus maricopensis DSM 21211]
MTTPDVPASPPTAPPPAGAVPLQARDTLPDLLRGVAIGMILLVNMQDFAGFAVWQQHGLDRAAQVLTDTLVNGKGISLFAMLFGAGAATVHARHGTSRLARRLGALLLLGAAHFVLIWHGDIMAQYALIALPLVLLLHLPPRGLLVAAAATAAASVFAPTGVVALGTLVSGVQQLGEPRYAPTEVSATLPYLNAVQARAQDLVHTEWGVITYGGTWLLTLMLLGAYAQRAGLLSRPHEHQPAWRAVMLVGFGFGVPTSVVLALLNGVPQEWADYAADPARFVSGVLLAFGYAGALALLVVRGRAWLPLVQAGRLSLTTYLTQSVVMTFVFYGWGLRQYGTWGAAASLLLGLVVYAAQVAFARWYVPRYGRGPMERVLRWLVYGRAA